MTGEILGYTQGRENAVTLKTLQGGEGLVKSSRGVEELWARCVNVECLSFVAPGP